MAIFDVALDKVVDDSGIEANTVFKTFKTWSKFNSPGNLDFIWQNEIKSAVILFHFAKKISKAL
jgi:hypothetical protein